MSGPCVTDGNCTHMYMDGNNLRSDLKIDPNPNNAAVCNLGGLYVQSRHCRTMTAASGPLLTNQDGLLALYNSLSLDLIPWSNDPDVSARINHEPIPITDVSDLTYTNTSNATEVAIFDVTMGQCSFWLKAGWDMRAGISVSWSGPTALVPVVGFNTNVGFATGLNAYDQAWAVTDTPAGVSLNGPKVGGTTEIAPGETITVSWRTFVSYRDHGANNTTSAQRQGLVVSFLSRASLTTWTK